MVRRVIVAEDSLVAVGSLADMAAKAAQVFGKGTEEDSGAKGKAQRKVRLLGICERSIADEKLSGCDWISPTAKIWIGLTGALDVLVKWKGSHPIGEVGSFGNENRCLKTKCQRAQKPDQVALGGGLSQGLQVRPVARRQQH